MIRADELKAVFPTEAVLCQAFITEANSLDDWTCYPETGDFDIILVHADGRQIGVEAKLRLNAKVAEQALPSHGHERHGIAGPDHRVVLVPSISESNAGIARMLEMLGVAVWFPSVYDWSGMRSEKDSVVINGKKIDFQLREKLRRDADVVNPSDEGWRHYYPALFDWNPENRVTLPNIVPLVAAGVPAPIRMTPWKMGAMRVLARLRVQGYITAKQITEDGISPSIWTQVQQRPGGSFRWLVQGVVRGQWVESPDITKIDQQHPELYAHALAEAQEKYGKAFALEVPG
jgi:hypothetical protein